MARRRIVKFVEGNEVIEMLSIGELRFIHQCATIEGGCAVREGKPRCCRVAEDMKDLGLVRPVARQGQRTYWVATDDGRAVLRVRPARGAYATVIPLGAE